MEQNGTSSGHSSLKNVKEMIADKLDRAAGSLGRRAEEESALSPYSRQACDWLHQSANYVRNFDIDRADMQLRNEIRNNPGRCMLIGLAAGVLVGMWIRRR